MILDILTVLFFVLGFVLLLSMIAKRRRDVLHGPYVTKEQDDLTRGADGKTEGLTMGSDGTKGGPADVPITSDAQTNRGLAHQTPAKEKKTAGGNDPPGLEQGGRLP